MTYLMYQTIEVGWGVPGPVGSQAGAEDAEEQVLVGGD